jgi:hypothetical protein
MGYRYDTLNACFCIERPENIARAKACAKAAVLKNLLVMHPFP